MELTPEQVADRKNRLQKASTLLGTRIKDIIQEVEQTHQFRFTFGLDYSPYGIQPSFIPTDTKSYGEPTTQADG